MSCAKPSGVAPRRPSNAIRPSISVPGLVLHAVVEALRNGLSRSIERPQPCDAPWSSMSSASVRLADEKADLVVALLTFADLDERPVEMRVRVPRFLAEEDGWSADEIAGLILTNWNETILTTSPAELTFRERHEEG